MPHKHKRKRGDDDVANFDLPPDARANALPVNHKPRAVVANDDGEDDSQQPKRSNKRRKPSKASGGNANDPQQKALLDDTPKQFARLMAFQQQGKKLRKGLDDGVPQPKAKAKKGAASKQEEPKSGVRTTAPADNPPDPDEANAEQDESQQKLLKIQPGERLGDFALRVDQSLPLSAVPKHSTRAPPGERQDKAYLTKHNKRLARLQAAWRTDEERLQEKRTEQKEEAQDQREEEGLLWMDVDEARKGRKGKKSSREGDIWKVLEKKRREEEREGGSGGDRKVAGLSAATAVQAPPVLKGVKNMFKERGARQQGGRRQVAT